MNNILIAGLAIAALLSATPGLAEVQSLHLPAPLPMEGYGLVAQGEAQVSLPDPYSPGNPDLPDSRIPIVPDSPIHGTNVRAAGGPNTGTQAELSMAVAGSNIVISFNGGTNGGGYVNSTDGGLTWGAITSPPRPANSSPCCDTGVVADFLGRFYYLELYRNDGAGNCTNSLHVSADGGQTFGGITGSPFSYASGTTDFPDMPHMGIDRVNLVSGNPQLYVYTRHFTSGINCPQTGTGGTTQGEVTCSVDGGAAWIAPIVLAPFTDLAHFATGSDGSVYLVGNGTGGTILLRRSTNSCNAGLAFGGAVTVASGLTYGPVGIDREFPQPYVAVDKLDPNVAYVAWSSDRLANDNDRDIFLCRCTFTGTAGACEAPVRVNDDPVGTGNDQYFPMLAVDPNNNILLQWNDQRAGNRSTGIYHTEVKPAAAALSVGPSYLVSEVNFTPQNFNGTPDYGDYNENNDAADGQHLYTAWVSHVSPPGISPASNDPDIFFAVVNNLQDVRVSGSLDFGDVCIGDSETRELSVYNVGDAFLTVDSVARVAGSTDITVDPNPQTPLTIGPGEHVDFVIRCTPTSIGVNAATIRVTSDDPDQPEIDLTYTCNTPPGDIRVTGSTDFGSVCADEQAERTISICNVGDTCNLNVTSVSFDPPCDDFEIINNPFPSVISHDSCLDLTIRFTPTSAGPKSCSLVIESDDPDQGTITLEVTAETPLAAIDVPLDLAFPPTVIQSVGACSTLEEFPISNTGECNLTITDIQLSGENAGDYSFVGLPSFPIILEPGHVVGDGDFRIAFAPTELDRDRTAIVTVTYVSDPVANTLDEEARALCGEGVRTGARVLVTNMGTPLQSVSRIKLLRVVGNRRTTTEVVKDAQLTAVAPAPPCQPFQYHREYGTVSNPIQLLPGNYEVTAQTKLDGHMARKTVFFDVSTCDFNPQIEIDLGDPSDAGVLAGREPTTNDGDDEIMSEEDKINASFSAGVPEKTALAGIDPNPFNPSATVSFDLASEVAVRLDVYNERGVRVRTLENGVLPAGRHQVTWDGRDSAGQSTATGVYFFRFSAGEVNETMKAVLMK